MNGEIGMFHSPSQVRGTMPTPAADNPCGRNVSMPRTTHIRPAKTARTMARARRLSFPLSISVVHSDEQSVVVAAHRHVLAGWNAPVGDEAAVDRRRLRRGRAAVRVHAIPDDAAG